MSKNVTKMTTSNSKKNTFRTDPVPGSGRKRYSFHRYPKLLNEKKHWDKLYGRAKRSISNLTIINKGDTYLEIRQGSRKRTDINSSWKKIKKFKKQYMKSSVTENRMDMVSYTEEIRKEYDEWYETYVLNLTNGFYD